MNRYYIAHNQILSYWLIRINSTLSEEDCANIPFKGKTLEGALKAAQKYCNESNAKIKYRTLTVGEVLGECNYWGKEVNK